MRLVAALSILLLLTACSKPFVRQTPAPPSEAAVYCSPLLEPVIRTQDDLVRAYADLLDSWTECAQRHKALVDWL